MNLLTSQIQFMIFGMQSKIGKDKNSEWDWHDGSLKEKYPEENDELDKKNSI